tara:strand:- start:38 stop:226 length:189 start_codon:yes stop_codon:yes gene_type:complete
MKSPKKYTNWDGAGTGLIIGIIIGAMTDNIGWWVAMGLIFGAAFDSKDTFKKVTSNKKKKKK